jgi:hypothetical protein
MNQYWHDNRSDRRLIGAFSLIPVHQQIMLEIAEVKTCSTIHVRHFYSNSFSQSRKALKRNGYTKIIALGSRGH